MNFQIKIDQEIDRKSWHDFVAFHPYGNIFQTPEMYDFFLTVSNYQPLAIACLDENDKIQGVLLAVIEREHSGFIGKFSSRTIVWGGPLLAEPVDENVMALILEALIKKLGKKTIYLELRNLFDLSNKLDIFKQRGFVFKEHLNFQVQTAAGEEPQKKLSSNRKRQIKKSLASGINIEEAATIEQVDEFYRILFIKIYFLK